MKKQVETLLTQALQAWLAAEVLTVHLPSHLRVERTRDVAHGDFACNIAMVLAKQLKRKPRDIAESVVKHFPESRYIACLDIAGPGFINIYLTPDALQQVVKDVLAAGESFGCSDMGLGQRVQVEFVSANPTGPLHVGHGRSVAYGAALSDLLAAAGYDVHREYYVNDAGRQMNILAVSVWLRYLSLYGEKFTFPSNGYQGDYITAIAGVLFHEYAKSYYFSAADVFTDVPADFDEKTGQGDKEAHIDALIARAQTLLGPANFKLIRQKALAAILDDIKQDLADFGVEFQTWFLESTLFENDALTQAIGTLKEKDYVYEQDGALWFCATDFGDEKDRVITRANGTHTYFASDLAYHADKFRRGFDHVIDIFGADHHGYVSRINAAVQALGFEQKLTILLVQFATLYRGKERVQMSTRSGSFVTLRQLRDEVGNDAARFFYVMRKCEQHMDFDLELAKSKSNENPVYYIQYAHARVCSVMRQMAEKGLTHDCDAGMMHLDALAEVEEQHLLRTLGRYPEIIETAAQNYEPHMIANYLKELAGHFHVYYNSHQFLLEDDRLRHARINLSLAVRQVLANGLHLLGVSAPESM